MSAELNNNKPDRTCKTERSGSFFAPKSLVIGLTGGIATGKSTVAHLLQELGAKVIDADAIVHELLQPGTETYRQVVAKYGDAVLTPDGRIDRKKLGRIVFQDAEKRRQLEDIIHPGVFGYLKKEIERFRNCEGGVLVIEIPLLIETSSMDLVDKVLVVTAEQETQISRLQIRDGINREGAIRRISAQLPIAEKIKHADWVVSTEGTFANTREQVNRVWLSAQKTVAQRK